MNQVVVALWIALGIILNSGINVFAEDQFIRAIYLGRAFLSEKKITEVLLSLIHI